MDFITSNTMRLSEKSLDYLWLKQEAVTDNIVNAETPGYKSKYFTFEQEFRRRLDGNGEKTKKSYQDAINDSRIFTRISRNESNRLDGNNVVADVEQAELARTTLQYQFTVDAFNSDISRLRTAIKGQ